MEKMKEHSKEEESRLRNRVIQYAATLQRLTARPRYAHMKRAEEIVRLEQLMLSGTARFSYLGQDGGIRHIKGTLINYMENFGVPYRAKPYSRFMLYYDLEDKAWKTFQVTGLI